LPYSRRGDAARFQNLRRELSIMPRTPSPFRNKRAIGR
jgi:hypothetical protein